MENTQVILEVTDSGIGIAEEYLAHIFDRFYRTDSARSSATGGSGLGLAIVKKAIVKKIVAAHGGTVTVESKPGVGSKFRVLLPILTSSEAPRGEDNQDHSAGVVRNASLRSGQALPNMPDRSS